MTLKNYQFHCSLQGNSQKPLILFLHGFMGDIEEFDEVIKLLGEDFYYLTIDLPGHGKTQVLGGDEYYKMEPTAQALIKLLDKLEIIKCFLVGYSMGGRLGLYLMLHFPERFFKVVLESVSPGLETGAERLARIKGDSQIAKKITRMVNKNELKIFLNNWYSQAIFGDIKTHQLYEQMLIKRLDNNPLELAKSLRFMGTGYQPSLWDKMQENKIPVLLLVGKYDEKFITINTAMAYRCGNAQLKIIKKAGHNIHLENTLAFVKTIRDFLI
ncbi:2-succinyl-6-hydroxy-2,4-cyclohexadiene-1-carboxylate synthase [Anabaena cylindrica FACHB-243]|uniref:Putative 2-succinyl-6-hydroxy-2,4-cyclohexadiene-1-carboxylate synthase n=1 Tax=Anabaena cylindrica (strain ATCC 27899 / PCC 7122) TaxID=272123 RepID=K9ZBD0_ANACC|nr:MULTISPECIES: 2-succinyl-6-hydroxy-2,4-cyclohexadiene-1-carboxylate synthase [Anabaena]AFZ56491.1 2-succinyl-6-hydroxy-2,4-cyclohexadiene-1-carbox ylatesynthase [Anabaena cylindrica PCC 7122]MBD2418528.1 2-succinyl-6-hydroxy-2,4-cyclohexadiene-1-carboxylate synthase [Anabaena cylindrica FACHB-243]MBY5282913.1 2-succinyl-6-hydroxy-2,4-cyclohexadiene-1-carboxylate synthase [Anabaena sp. CCAP 1446/1C]MBY5311099.1 2-succinyl-6-hydroxy-2,4-cyclohexadiene-1-carboxylate synthase [Anabaena sp. CCAP 